MGNGGSDLEGVFGASMNSLFLFPMQWGAGHGATLSESPKHLIAWCFMNLNPSVFSPADVGSICGAAGRRLFRHAVNILWDCGGGEN